MSSRRVYLDKNSLSDLWRRGDKAALRRVRTRLTSPHFSRRPILILSMTTATELLRIHVSSRYEQEVDLLRRAETEWLRDMRDRAQVEVDTFLGRTPRVDMYEDPKRVVQMLDQARVEGRVRKSLVDDHLRITSQYAAQERRNRAAFDAQVARPNSVRSELLGDVAAQVRSWAGDYLRKSRQLLRLPRNEADWPDPSDLPTIWAYYSFVLARMALVVGDGRRIDGNDRHDAEHYAAAAYADDLVTSDRRFIEYASYCPPPKPRVLPFDDWVREVVAVEGG